jgi:hypothetical protein
MTPEQQRISIAEACGWTSFVKGGGAYSMWFPPNEKRKELQFTRLLPDYLNDLNEMNEAEKVLLKDVRKYLDYCGRLVLICGGSHDALFATAAQRAEVFLRTLGLWVETPTAERESEALRHAKV